MDSKCNENIFVSIIIPTYNRAKKLERSINSVLQQTYPWFELIIVDDASTDDTEKIIEEIDDSRIKYVKNEINKGPAASRNIGVSNALYDFIAFNDSDDVWLPQKLEKQVKKIMQDEALGLVYCPYYMCEEKRRYKVPSDLTSENDLEGEMFSSLTKGNKIGTPTMLIRKECFDQIGGFDVTLSGFEDWEFVLRLYEVCKIGYLNEILVNAEWSSNGVNENKANRIPTCMKMLDMIEKRGEDTSGIISRIVDAVACCEEDNISVEGSEKLDKILSEKKLQIESARSKNAARKKLFEILENENFLKAFLDRIGVASRDKIAIYGAGGEGIALSESLERLGMNIICFFDRNDVVLKKYDVRMPANSEKEITTLFVTIGKDVDASKFNEWIGESVKTVNIYDIIKFDG